MFVHQRLILLTRFGVKILETVVLDTQTLLSTRDPVSPVVIDFTST